MTDHDYKAIADRIVAQGVGECTQSSYTDYWYWIGAPNLLQAEQFCHDWRVAGALMEKVKADGVGPITISTPRMGDFYVRVYDGNKGHVTENESLPLAIVLACLEALENE